MHIVVASTAGFCFGVNNAVKIVFDLAEKSEDKVYTFGPIIHNEQVVNKLQEHGILAINSPEQVSAPSKVVIRAHGVGPSVISEFEAKGIEVVNATCPYVEKMQRLVNKKYNEGYQIIIIGDKEHPEIIGITGWCNNTAYIIDSIEQVKTLPNIEKNICVVAQTTFIREKWEKIIDSLNKRFKNVLKFDTICNATDKRQSEADKISKEVDMVLVIGGENSSNTNKLFEICRANCPETYKIQTASDIPPVDIKKIKKIGITAGASTPDWVIKEVIHNMSELNKQDLEMSFADAFESSLVTLTTGQITKGRIIGFNLNEVYVDLGFKSDGIIPMEEFTDDIDFDPEKSLKVGDEVDVFVVRVNDGEGNVILSKKKVDAVKGWEVLEDAFENKRPIAVKISEQVNGGVIGYSHGVKIFIPASQISDRFVKDLSSFVRQVVQVQIIEINKQKRKVVASARIIIERNKEFASNEIWNNIEIGKVYKGQVKSLMDFGAFVDIGGVDGLVHLSELSWNKIKHPSEVVKVGDEITVYVIDFDKEKKRISLGFKKKEDNPWVSAIKKYEVGNVITGKVVRLVPFGAFVEIEQGLDGLVHISQISSVRLGKPGDVLKIGQEVQAKITELDAEAKKISLSIKEVNPIDPKGAKKDAPVAADEELPTEHKEDMTNTIAENLNSLND
ncbi:bifunctional 4-hydroxy-3-methylbut-2-enyl diphosphate reductase/30S ribosomal protein S1 [Ruminiclostridium herbifermentans]|uniref:4-hydroxy-3-methylbut-2-enyl diphosphate reductase n=1 Tax=Ruminiclostridium herbifermentans TaxID=2488810 RepID=A0A4U7JK85_9FIRM|nr:bifunctional 4-hydroxy-3-methylbut-2-enyl diphosphate reductase/30S ribosomal protein S1 [Ruminiclostridium herbifermentans]QNU65315.1 bifunctional 4-hydroxy-3-methylbut-2-enyl diphosphate reductase/30S ribosomal protein S1 [Ruminiclostridium herbifermentans]